MSRYFFHIKNGVSSTDEHGVELADLDAARAYAVRVSSEILRDGSESFWGSQPWTVTVADSAGVVLFGLAHAAMDQERV